VTSALDDVVSLVGVVSDLLGDELLLDDTRSVATLLLELVDVATGDEGVARPEAPVGLSGGALEGDHVVEGRVEPGEGPVDLLAPLLDTDAQPAALVALLGEVKLRRRCDEADQARLGGDGHVLLLTRCSLRVETAFRR
jgi:hypothetical protein